MARDLTMRRTCLRFLAGMLLAGPVPAFAQAAGSAPAQPPHAWLFGTWTGGMFPVPAKLSAQACLSQPVVIFTRDLVLRATLMEQTLTQRVIETARTGPQAVDFRFAPAGPSAGLLGPLGSPATGFGCESPEVLHVKRQGENEITFPGCADFPNTLVRCQTQ